MELFSLKWHDVIGIIGVAFYICNYFLLQVNLLDGNSITYTILNLLAATLVLISLVNTFNLPSVLIQVSWILISLVGIVLRLNKSIRSKRKAFVHRAA